MMDPAMMDIIKLMWADLSTYSEQIRQNLRNAITMNKAEVQTMILGEHGKLLVPADIEINFVEFSAWGARPHKDLDITHSWKSGRRSANTFEVESSIGRASQYFFENRKIAVNIRLPPYPALSRSKGPAVAFDSAGYRYNATDQSQRLFAELVLGSVHRSQLQQSAEPQGAISAMVYSCRRISINKIRITTRPKVADRCSAGGRHELSDGDNQMPLGSLLRQPHTFKPEEPDEECSICHNGGDLLICDGCEKNFHLQCVSMSTIGWFCPACNTNMTTTSDADPSATTSPLCGLKTNYKMVPLIVPEVKHNLGDVVWAQDCTGLVHYPAQIHEIYDSPSGLLYKCFYISEPSDDGTLLFDHFSGDRVVKWELGRQLGAVPKNLYREVALAEKIRSGKEKSPMYHQLLFDGVSPVGQLLRSSGKPEGFTAALNSAVATPILEEEEDVACEICERTNFSDKDQILLCDGCPRGYHTRCLPYPTQSIPQGDWYCPSCNLNSIAIPSCAAVSCA